LPTATNARFARAEKVRQRKEDAETNVVCTVALFQVFVEDIYGHRDVHPDDDLRALGFDYPMDQCDSLKAVFNHPELKDMMSLEQFRYIYKRLPSFINKVPVKMSSKTNFVVVAEFDLRKHRRLAGFYDEDQKGEIEKYKDKQRAAQRSAAIGAVVGKAKTARKWHQMVDREHGSHGHHHAKPDSDSDDSDSGGTDTAAPAAVKATPQVIKEQGNAEPVKQAPPPRRPPPRPPPREVDEEVYADDEEDWEEEEGWEEEGWEEEKGWEEETPRHISHRSHSSRNHHSSSRSIGSSSHGNHHSRDEAVAARSHNSARARREESQMPESQGHDDHERHRGHKVMKERGHKANGKIAHTKLAKKDIASDGAGFNVGHHVHLAGNHDGVVVGVQGHLEDGKVVVDHFDIAEESEDTTTTDSDMNDETGSGSTYYSEEEVEQIDTAWDTIEQTVEVVVGGCQLGHVHVKQASTRGIAPSSRVLV
jgi:hypothetical protein